MNTSEFSLPDSSLWFHRQQELIASLRKQPLVMVLRPSEEDLSSSDRGHSSLVCLLDQLTERGVRHVEIAWSPSRHWRSLISALQARYPDLHLGAASITTPGALQAVIELRLAYAMSPCLDASLLEHARRQHQVLVPGVMTPSEIHRASQFGCELVKLFPAAVLGIDYHRQLSAPMGSLPFMIAAGGLRADQLDPWLAAGYDAIALGRSALAGNQLDPSLNQWLT